ncbi:MAG: hypothetical protein NT154_09480 [Verrucomicrobia bacterium]|nr:hypothetical protein [Verrucomicrobiota bacterium]
MKDLTQRVNAMELLSEQRDKWQTACHEAGHYVAAKHFAVHERAYIQRVGKATLGNKAYIGKTEYRQTTPFREAVIGWAGLIATDLADMRLAEWRALDAGEHFQDKCDVLLDDLSATDIAGIESHSAQWRTFKTAWGILMKRRGEFAGIVKQLMSSGSVDRWQVPPRYAGSTPGQTRPRADNRIRQN